MYTCVCNLFRFVLRGPGIEWQSWPPGVDLECYIKLPRLHRRTVDSSTVSTRSVSHDHMTWVCSIPTYLYLPTYTYLYLPIPIYLPIPPIPTYTYLYLPIPTYTYLYLPTYTYLYLPIPTCTHAHLHTCTHVHTYIRTYVHTFNFV